MNGRGLEGVETSSAVCQPTFSGIHCPDFCNALRKMASLDQYVKEIMKTGFPLEYRVGELFRHHRWNVIHSRYYLDDVAGVPREQDILAYRVRKYDDTNYYTAVLISCKKDAQNAWAFCTKDLRSVDPNIDWFPYHIWTNNPVLEFAHSHWDWKAQVLSQAQDEPFFDLLIKPETEVFAMQCMNKQSGKPSNDKPIYDSVSSLMKSQSYELESMRERGRSTPSFYNIFLLTVADTDLVRLHFVGDSQPEATEVSSDVYVGRHIVNQRSVDVRVSFCRASYIEKVVEAFDALHEFNCKFFPGLARRYYKNPFESFEACEVFREKLESAILWKVNLILDRYKGRYQITDIELCWLTSEDQLGLGIPVMDNEIEILNDDKKLKARAAEALRESYRYGGPFRFFASIPF